MTTDRRARLLAALLAVLGSTHFVSPRAFDALIPAALPGPARAWTWGSGVAELACAALIASPSARTRRVGATAAFVLFVAVFPGNVQMAVDWWDDSPGRRAVALLRLPLQIPLLVWAWRVRREAAAVEDAGR